MFEQFSRGYYLGRLYVEPREGDAAAMCRHQHETVNEQLYASDEGLERLDRPLVMKLEGTHFTVHGSPDVPADTLAVPRDLLENTRLDNPPALREVLLAKGDRAAQLLGLFGRAGESPGDCDGGPGSLDDGPGGPAGI
ncbi:DUF5802 family protein [Halobacteriales archaeon Cl-PHB]